AAALIFVNNDQEQAGGDLLMPFAAAARSTSSSELPFVQLRRHLAEQMVASSVGQDLRSIEQAINRDLKPRSAPLAGWKATLEVAVKRNVATVKNVIGVV